MKYQKATVAIIDLGEEEVIRCSGCSTEVFNYEDKCTAGNHKTKYSQCTKGGHLNY